MITCSAAPGGFIEQFQAHVVAGLGPFVGLFVQHRADQPDDRHLVREDPHDVGAPADFVPINRGRSAEAISDAMTLVAPRQP